MASRCLSSSEAILDVVSDLSRDTENGKHELQSVFAAGAMLSAANIQLWAYHVQGRDQDTRKAALSRIEQVTEVFMSWSSQWPVVDAWIGTLASLRRLYKATYAPDLSTPDTDNSEPPGEVAPPTLTESDAFERPYPRLTEGNGLPELNENMSDKVRFILLASLEDTDARERVLKSSMDVHIEYFSDLNGFPNRLDFDSDYLYADGLWPEFDASCAMDDSLAMPTVPVYDMLPNLEKD
jgi:hypothetical protein